MSNSSTARPPSLGVVKQVLSGGTIIIRDRPVNGPPPERKIVLSHISCGRLARRPSPKNIDSNTEDPFAWEAREFVRSKLIGKEVCYVVEKELPSGPLYGSVHLGKSLNGENIAISLLENGLAELRKINNVGLSEKNGTYQNLLRAEKSAKSAGLGKWSNCVPTPRVIHWTVEEPKIFLDQVKGCNLRGIVEYVRDGSTVQVTLLPDIKTHILGYYVLSMSISGIRAPGIHEDEGNLVYEPYAQAAHFFVESRLLQRDVVVLLESYQNQSFIGSILHPKGNIAEMILREGLARCIDWTLPLVSIPGAVEAYKTAEFSAKSNHLRLWKDIQNLQIQNAPSSELNQITIGTTFNGHVTEVGIGDNVTVKCSDGVTRKFFLSSIRGPKTSASKGDENVGANSTRTRLRPLYDVPYAFEAREHLRTFVGKPVSVLVDYIQPKTATVPDDRVCCTVKCGSINLAQSVVSQGLATVIAYRKSDDSRSEAYVELKTSEEQAVAKGLGMHSKSEPPVHRVLDHTNDLAKARQFLPFFKRASRLDAVVEFVVHASRMRVYLPKDSCIITLLLNGVQCPRKGWLDQTEETNMLFSTEASAFVRELCMQRNVEVSIDHIDRLGNFIGWVFLETSSVESSPDSQTIGKKKKKTVDQFVPKPKLNLSVVLVSKGLAAVHRAPSTETSPYYQELVKAEESAKQLKIGLWSSDEFVQNWEVQLQEFNRASNVSNEESTNALPGSITTEYIDDLSMLNLNDETSIQEESKIQWVPAQVTAISQPASGSEGLRFYAQRVTDSSVIVQISRTLNTQPPALVANYRPKKGETFAACFSADNCWYRAKLSKQDAKSITVHFVDFGNEEAIKLMDLSTRVAPLAIGSLVPIPPQAREYRLAFVQLPPDEIDRSYAEQAFANAVMNKEVSLAVRFDSIPCANETVKPVPAVSIKVPPISVAGSSSSATWFDVVELLLEEGFVCLEPMKPGVLKCLSRPVLSNYLELQAKAKKERKNAWRYGDFRKDNNV